MRAWHIQEFGAEGLREANKEPAAPLRAFEVRVRIRACSLNFRDHLMRLGLYNPKQPLPLVPCSDGAGTIVEVGSAVEGFAVEDRVAGTFFRSWTAGAVPRDLHVLKQTRGGPLDGMLQEEIVLRESEVVRIPEHLSFEEASTLPCAALTAYSALFTQADLKPGDTVVLQGTGGVSVCALQFAKAAGFRTIVTSSSEKKLERARQLGADLTVNYRQTPAWSRFVTEHTDGGADLVVEVGGAKTLAESLKAVRAGGQISLIGVLSGTRDELDLIPILMRNVRVQGILVGSAESFASMNRLIAHHQLRPAVDRVFAFEEAPAAFEHLAAAHHFGKVVIRGCP